MTDSMNMNMNRYWRNSLFFHLGVMAFLTALQLGGVYFHLGDMGKQEKVIKASSSIRVDIIEMPKLTLAEQRSLKLVPLQAKTPKPSAPAAPAAKASTPSSDDKNALEVEGGKKDSEKKSKLENLLKGLSKKTVGQNKRDLNSKADRMADKAGDKNSAAEEMKNLLLAGNKLSKGTGVVGKGNEDQEDAEFMSYLDSLLTQVRPYWKLPGHLAQQKLKCRVRIYLSREGGLVRTTIYESSGETLYDDKAVEAIKLAQPFPAPPQALVERVLDGEIILGFPI